MKRTNTPEQSLLSAPGERIFGKKGGGNHGHHHEESAQLSLEIAQEISSWIELQLVTD
jgi:hypothetical protein